MTQLLDLHYRHEGYQRIDARDPGGLSRQLDAYFAGDLSIIETLPTATAGPFQREVWQALRTIPCGQVMHYGQLAETLGRPGAARAVGAANGSNPVSIVVPCHRVIGRNGTMTGYAGGVRGKSGYCAMRGICFFDATCLLSEASGNFTISFRPTLYCLSMR